MFTKDSYRLVNQDLVDRGLMTIYPLHIALDRYFTEEEQVENRKEAQRLTDAEWNIRCEQIRQRIAEQVYPIVKMLAEKFVVYQFEGNFSKDYDLFFWCNNGDYSRCTLTVNRDYTLEQKERLFAEVKKILAECEVKNVYARFDYQSLENRETVINEAEKIFKAAEGKFIQYGNYFIGRLEKLDGEYIFKKKNAKKYCYRIRPIDVCTKVVINS